MRKNANIFLQSAVPCDITLCASEDVHCNRGRRKARGSRLNRAMRPESDRAWLTCSSCLSPSARSHRNRTSAERARHCAAERLCSHSQRPGTRLSSSCTEPALAWNLTRAARGSAERACGRRTGAAGGRSSPRTSLVQSHSAATVGAVPIRARLKRGGKRSSSSSPPARSEADCISAKDAPRIATVRRRRVSAGRIPTSDRRSTLASTRWRTPVENDTTEAATTLAVIEATARPKPDSEAQAEHAPIESPDAQSCSPR